eukprot:254764-Chlamydomonas_euryale.AAC.3
MRSEIVSNRQQLAAHPQGVFRKEGLGRSRTYDRTPVSVCGYCAFPPEGDAVVWHGIHARLPPASVALAAATVAGRMRWCGKHGNGSDITYHVHIERICGLVRQRGRVSTLHHKLSALQGGKSGARTAGPRAVRVHPRSPSGTSPQIAARSQRASVPADRRRVRGLAGAPASRSRSPSIWLPFYSPTPAITKGTPTQQARMALRPAQRAELARLGKWQRTGGRRRPIAPADTRMPASTRPSMRLLWE